MAAQRWSNSRMDAPQRERRARGGDGEWSVVVHVSGVNDNVIRGPRVAVLKKITAIYGQKFRECFSTEFNLMHYLQLTPDSRPIRHSPHLSCFNF